MAEAVRRLDFPEASGCPGAAPLHRCAYYSLVGSRAPYVHGSVGKDVQLSPGQGVGPMCAVVPHQMAALMPDAR